MSPRDRTTTELVTLLAAAVVSVILLLAAFAATWLIASGDTSRAEQAWLIVTNIGSVLVAAAAGALGHRYLVTSRDAPVDRSVSDATPSEE